MVGLGWGGGPRVMGNHRRAGKALETNRQEEVMGPLLSCLCLPILHPMNEVSMDGHSLISADLPQEEHKSKIHNF